MTAGDVYGRSPGMDAPDCVLLSSMTASMLKALHKEVDPPVIVVGSGKDVNMLPGGGDLYQCHAEARARACTRFAVAPQYSGTAAAINQIQQQVREGLFNNLFACCLIRTGAR